MAQTCEFQGSRKTQKKAGLRMGLIGCKRFCTAIFHFLSLVFIVIAGCPTSYAQTVVKTIPLGTNGEFAPVALNPVTNKIYYITDKGLGLLDEATNTISTVSSVTGKALAVNPATNQIYVAGSGISIIDGVTNNTSNIAVGVALEGIAVNPVTNKIYATDSSSDTVIVLDGTTLTTTSIPVGPHPFAIAVNPATDKVYVTNSQIGSASGNTLTVIDGSKNSVDAVVPVGNDPQYVLVNPGANKIYVSNAADGGVTIINGATNTVVTTIFTFNFYSTIIDFSLTRGAVPLTLNPASNKIYAVGDSNGGLTVIDGSTDVATTVAIPFNVSVGVDPFTNQVFTGVNPGGSQTGGRSVTVLNGADNSVKATLTSAANPVFLGGIAVNALTGKVYVEDGTNVDVIDVGAVPIQSVPLTTTITPFPSATTSNPLPTFNFSAASTSSPNATFVENIYFQLDSQQGTWTKANGQQGIPTSVVLPGTHTVFAFATDGQEANATGGVLHFVGNVASQQFTETGTTTVPTAVLGTGPITFSAEAVGTPSAANVVSLTNGGNAALTINSISITGANNSDFSETNTCGTSLAAGTKCSISVVFNPTATGLRSATLQVSDNGANTTIQRANLIGIGIPPSATLSPLSINFPETTIGTSSAPVPVVLTTGSAITISSITITGTGASSYSQTNNCGSSVPAAGSCTILVTFNPNSVSIGFAGLTVTDSAGNSPQTVSLSGIADPITASPSSLTFPATILGKTSAVQTVTLKNISNAAVGFNTPPPTAGDFAETNNCPTVAPFLPPGQTCTLSVTFTPTKAGLQNINGFDVQFSAVGSGSGEDAFIGVTGVGVAPQATLSPSQINFSNQLINTTSAAQTVTLTNNTGSGPVTITSITLTDATNYSQTNNCGTSLAVGASCTISVTFAPKSRNVFPATLQVVDSAPNSPQTTSLSGQAIGPIANLVNGISFGNQAVGTPSAAQPVTLKNFGDGALSITSIAITGTNPSDFSQTNNCGATLAAGANCTINVTFKPTASGSRSAAVTVTDNDSSAPQTASLTGTGTTIAPSASLSPASLLFSTQAVGTTSASQSVSLSNSGNAALAISSIAVAGANNSDFSQTNTCGSSLAAGANCAISVTFKPTTVGARSASLTVTDNAGNSPQTVSLSGTGATTAPSVALAPASLTFITQAVGTTSAAQQVALSNSGNAPLTISSIAVTGANSSDFSQTTTCGTSVAAGANCSINVTFKPTASGSRTASVTITDNAGNSPQTVTLSGTATDFSVAPAQNSTTTATVTAGKAATFSLQIIDTGAPQTLSLTCTGAPQGATCIVPATMNVTPGTPATVNVNVTTTARGALISDPRLFRWRTPGSSNPVFWLLSLVAMLLWRTSRNQDRSASPRSVWLVRLAFVSPLLLLVLSVAAISGCAGGSGTKTLPTPNGTPAGISTLTVTATSNGISRSTQLTLTVQ